MEQIPEIRSSITEGKNWKEIADYQREFFFNETAEKADFDEIVKLVGIYENQAVDALADGFKCENCKQEASNRCSRCKSVWYCSRECQIAHFKAGHKKICKQLAEEYNKKHQKKGDEIQLGLNKAKGEQQKKK